MILTRPAHLAVITGQAQNDQWHNKFQIIRAYQKCSLNYSCAVNGQAKTCRLLIKWRMATASLSHKTGETGRPTVIQIPLRLLIYIRLVQLNLILFLVIMYWKTVSSYIGIWKFILWDSNANLTCFWTMVGKQPVLTWHPVFINFSTQNVSYYKPTWHFGQ